MENNNMISEIDSQISYLGNLKTIFGTKTNRFRGFITLDKIDSKISSIKNYYYFYLALSISMGGLLCVSGLAQIFDFKFLNLSKSGLLIILTLGNILMTTRHKFDIEKLKMIKKLLELKLMAEKE